jgi:hypothetical protein
MRQLIEAAHPHTWWGRWVREDIDLAELHARNVDKQRRRLLAERLERLAQGHVDNAVKLYQAVGTLGHMADIERRIARSHKRIDRLRAIAARLRGTK